ncbi:hypothetical protein GCM10011610_00910 [Nocardia rhizosphaerihabitans]|uniref:Uncharacterized protein n=1 Tax=Nocardia rhizosphaerihabitans TaxID=1691570 RepID=A0ABQ2K4D3_9NOCA|nr:hypothetical protein GCM10011610_00910 [Nocardia rhizosphaerihabitans]
MVTGFFDHGAHSDCSRVMSTPSASLPLATGDDFGWVGADVGVDFTKAIVDAVGRAPKKQDPSRFE